MLTHFFSKRPPLCCHNLQKHIWASKDEENNFGKIELEVEKS